jgi:hypothetical protein
MAYTQWNISLKTKGKFDTCYNMDESRGLYANWNILITKALMPYDSTHMNYLKKQIHRNGK